MGPEYFGSREADRKTDHTEQNMVDAESERPSPSEVPGLAFLGADSFGRDAGDGFAWKSEEADREAVELPQLEDSQYYSTYEERRNQTPKEDGDRGEWSGERGESDFTPNDEEVRDILNQYGKEGISYQDAIPDFSEMAESTVTIGNMTENRADNFRQCDEKCAEQWNKEARDGRTDWTARDVKEWRQENGYSWHERNDTKTCDLVPAQVNDYFGHLGGVSECRKRDAEKEGSSFDE